MPKYTIRFTGRLKGAIGISYPIQTEREGDTPSCAVYALYDEYENIGDPIARISGDADNTWVRVR